MCVKSSVIVGHEEVVDKEAKAHEERPVFDWLLPCCPLVVEPERNMLNAADVAAATGAAAAGTA